MSKDDRIPQLKYDVYDNGKAWIAYQKTLFTLWENYNKARTKAWEDYLKKVKEDAVLSNKR